MLHERNILSKIKYSFEWLKKLDIKIMYSFIYFNLCDIIWSW